MREFLGRLGWHHTAALLLVVALVLYRRYTSERPWSVVLPKPQFHPFGPGESPVTPPLAADDYSRLIDLEDFRFEVNSHPCASAPAGLLVVALVTSAPRNFDNRRVIRSTWGRAADSSRLLFFVGDSADENVARHIAEESAIHGDLVRGNFVDAYRNMTYKHVMALKWVTYHCPQARYILKTDDDVLVNSVELRKFLSQEISPWGARDLIACHVVVKARALRSFRSKWRVSPEEYPHRYYPTYCLGWAIIYSADAVQRLYVEAQKSSYFWLDDVLLTGVLAERAEIPRSDIGNLILSYSQVKMMTVFNYKPTGAFLFGPYNLPITLIYKLWMAISSV